MTADIGLSLRLPAEVAAGERVPLTLTVENVSDKTIELYLRGRTIAFDIIVRNHANTTVWQRLSGEIIPAILQLKPLAARETMVLTAQWDQRTNAGTRVPPGTYLVTGLLLTDDAPWSTDAVPLIIRGAEG